MQLVGAGFTAFESNHASFSSLREITAVIPEHIATFLQLLKEGHAAEVAAHGQSLLDTIATATTRAVKISEKIEKSFDELIPLAQELLVAILTKSGNIDGAVAQVCHFFYCIFAQTLMPMVKARSQSRRCSSKKGCSPRSTESLD
jgi:ABC-type enterochelin transport system substrate-binding protein